MTDLAIFKDNLPLQEQIKDVQKLQEKLDFSLIQSVGATNKQLELLDYERYFKANYYCRFNEVSTEYENMLVYVDEATGEETGYWVELSVNEVMNDMIRAGAKGKGQLTEAEVGRMLGDRRLVPSYNPFIGYFNSLSNYLGDDNFSHIEDFANYVKIEGGEKEQERWVTNFKKGLVRTVKCALEKDYFNKHCIVLHSTNQSVGKTSYLRTLTPPPLKNYYFEGMIGADKDSQTVLVKNFIIMIDELANLSRLDINVLKATLSKLAVNIRLPYAKNFENFPRRASFFGTTNRADFLTDSENVRWLVFSVEDIDRSYGNIFTGDYKVDIHKVWAEAYNLYKSGYNCELSREDMAINEQNNAMYSATSLEKEVIETYLEPASISDKGKKGFYKGRSSEIFENICNILARTGREHTLKNLRQNVFFIEMGRLAQFKKCSIRDGGKVYSGYYYFVSSEKDSNQENEIPF